MVLSENETHKSMKQNRQPERKKETQAVYLYVVNIYDNEEKNIP